MRAGLRVVVAWLLAPARRRWTYAAAACVTVVAVVTAVVVAQPDDDELTERVAAAVARPDPVPHGPVVTSIPPDCGLSVATIDRLVGPEPGTEEVASPDEQSCSWGDLLDVEVRKAHELARPRERVQTAYAAYVDPFVHGTDHSSVRSVRPVEGLGTDAVAWKESDDVSDGTHTHVGFWQGNVAVEVAYGGEVATVLRTAAEVAGSMELTSGDVRLGEASDRTVDSPPAVCELLPASVVEQVGASGERESEDSYLLDEEESAKASGCSWDGRLDVEVGTAQKSSLGTGAQVAARRYVDLYLAARSGSGVDWDNEDAEVSTVPLRGLGDEAFAVYQVDYSAEARVVFRMHDTLVRITVEPRDYGDDPGRRDLLDTAYRAAQAAARQVAA